MSQRFYQELHNTSVSERGESGRVPLRQYVNTLKAKSQTMANSHLREFLDEVFSSDGASRFFKMFLHRFLSDSKSAGDDSSGSFAWAYALARPSSPYCRK